jgi:hypothetical protein
VVASKCSCNHFLSEKYQTTKQYNHLSYISFNWYNYTLLPATVKVLETILWKPFQLFYHMPNCVSSITKVPSLQCWFQSREQVKNGWSQVRRVWGMLQCCHIVLCQEILDQNWPVCWSIVIKELPTVDAPFFEAFPSDHVPKAMKDVSVHTFIHSSSACKLYQWILGTFETTVYIYDDTLLPRKCCETTLTSHRPKV